AARRRSLRHRSRAAGAAPNRARPARKRSAHRPLRAPVLQADRAVHCRRPRRSRSPGARRALFAGDAMDLAAPRSAARAGEGAGRRHQRSLAGRRRAQGAAHDARVPGQGGGGDRRGSRRERERRQDLPPRISNLAGGELDEYKALIEKTSARDGELFLYALLAVMNRLAAPWQIIRFGVRAAGSDTAARVAESHYGVTVTIALAELERMVAELREDLRSGAGVAVGALLKAIHAAARGLRTELDLPVDSTWGRALAAQRAQIAEMLRAEIESAPGRMRRLLRARPSSEIRANSALDADEVAEIEALIGFVGNCRSFASELAINEMTQRTFSEIQQYLDSGTRALLDGLRHAGDIDRSFRQSQVDAAVRFCAKVFGADYAALLTKAAEVAGAAERKAK